MIPHGAAVKPLACRLAELDVSDAQEEWYGTAVRILRGGDGGEHGMLLYKLVSEGSQQNQPLVVLDVGTARGFSALTMARAMLDGELEGRVYSVDVIGHDEPVNWHGTKQDADEPLAGVEMSRSEIWRRWFAEESRLVTTIEGRSLEVLSGWRHGPIDNAFLDGSHEYEDVKGELEALDSLMAEGGVIVVDDFHLGMTVMRVRSRLLNAVPGRIGGLLGRAWPGARTWSRRLSASNEYAIVRQRLSGVRNAVVEFVEEREGRWALEIVTMPSRGEYQGGDYSLAVLSRATAENREAV